MSHFTMKGGGKGKNAQRHRRQMVERARATQRKRQNRIFDGYETSVSNSEMDTRALLLTSISKMAADFKGASMRPDYASFFKAVKTLNPAMPMSEPTLNYQKSFKIASQPSVINSSFLSQHMNGFDAITALQSIDQDAFNEDAKNENLAKNHFIKTMILTSLGNILKGNQSQNSVVSQLQSWLDQNSTDNGKGLRIPKSDNEEEIHQAILKYLDRLERGMSRQRGGMNPVPGPYSLPTITSSMPTITPPVYLYPTGSESESASASAKPANAKSTKPANAKSTKPANTVESAIFNLEENISRASANNAPNATKKVVLNAQQQSTLQQAMDHFGIKQEIEGSKLSTLQSKMIELSDKIREHTGVSIYASPFSKPEPLVTKEAQQKYAFIRGPLEELKNKLASESPDRFGVLQYNSIMNILTAIRIGNTHTVRGDVATNGRTKINDPQQISRAMIDLANYDPRYTNVSFYVQRDVPTTTETILSYFKGETNFVVKKIYIMYTFNETAMASNKKSSREVQVYHKNNNDNNDNNDSSHVEPNSYVLEFNPLQFREFEPFAARYVMPSVGNIEQVISAIKNIVELDVSFIGFYRPDTSIAAILANLQTTDPIIKRIIANVAEFSKIAIELTKLKTTDMLIMGLNKDANNPSKELELRTKSYQLQQHIHAMASEGLEWDGATVDKLVKLAVDMAVTSGKLDKTLADDKALTNFIKNTTAIALNGLKQAMEAVSETSDLMGSMMLGSVRAVNGVQKALLREEMIGLYIYFMIYYFSKKYFFTFWTMPLMKPVGPIIGMEWMAKSALGVEPSKMTPFIMMFLFYLVWDRQPLDPLTNSMSSLVGMCRRRAAEAPNGEQQQAPNVPPVVQQPAPQPVVQQPALQVNVPRLQGPSSSSSSRRGATTPRRREHSSSSYHPSERASYRNQGLSSSSSSSSYHPSARASSSRAPLTPRSHLMESQRIAALYRPNEHTDEIDEIMLIIPGISYDDAVDLHRRRLDPRFIKSSMDMGLSYREVLSEVLQIRGGRGRRTRKNKKQNRRRTRK